MTGGEIFGAILTVLIIGAGIIGFIYFICKSNKQEAAEKETAKKLQISQKEQNLQDLKVQLTEKLALLSEVNYFSDSIFAKYLSKLSVVISNRTYKYFDIETVKLYEFTFTGKEICEVEWAQTICKQVIDDTFKYTTLESWKERLSYLIEHMSYVDNITLEDFIVEDMFSTTQNTTKRKIIEIIDELNIEATQAFETFKVEHPEAYQTARQTEAIENQTKAITDSTDKISRTIRDEAWSNRCNSSANSALLTLALLNK